MHLSKMSLDTVLIFDDCIVLLSDWLTIFNHQPIREKDCAILVIFKLGVSLKKNAIQ